MSLSVAIITCNEERNLRRTLESLRVADEIVVVDSGSTDRTIEIARELGAKVWIEPWKGYAAQKNSAIEKCTGDWILSLDADEAVSDELARELRAVLPDKASTGHERPEWCRTMDPGGGGHPTTGPNPTVPDIPLPESPPDIAGYFIPRKNFFLGRWIKHGGFWPDAKLRLFRRGHGHFEERLVHETMVVDGPTGRLRGAMLHDAYPTLEGYIAQMNRYSTLGAQITTASGPQGFSLMDIVVRPSLTFIYNYFLRLGFLDGPEGLLLHLYHAGYVSWKYAKAWERSRHL